MRGATRKAPHFIVIGAQKAGTTWLWSMLRQHPGTSLPREKEIHYFGSAELYAKGDDWYYRHFEDCDPRKIIGEASTSYFYDQVPYWHNPSDRIEFDDALPVIPELISRALPDVKYIVLLRDPVHRAISAYSHWMKQGRLSPRLGLKRVAIERPKMRILEYGYYAKYLETWLSQIPPQRFRILIFEDQVKGHWADTLKETYEYLGLDPAFKPQVPEKAVHRSWGWSRIVFNYYSSKISTRLGRSRLGSLADRFDVLAGRALSSDDVRFLRDTYLPEKEKLASLIGRDLGCWDYGTALLERLNGGS